MQLTLRDSLLIRLGLVMSAIILLAFMSMTASLFIADTIHGMASAINESGALRMRSYRIASNLVHELPDDQHYQSTLDLVNDFENHLNLLNLTHVIPADKQHSLRISYEQIKTQWQDDIKPLFDLYLDGIEDISNDKTINSTMMISKAGVINLRNRYLLVVHDFVKNIDHLVKLLEKNAELKIERLRFYQFIALMLTILLVGFVLVLVYKRVHMPMKELLKGSDHVRQRDFSFHINYTGYDELGQLGYAFNSMAKDLSAIYEKLEERVQEKTSDLERSRCSMELLYKIVKHLNESSSPHTTFPFILNDIEELLKTTRGAICLNDENHQNATMLASNLDADDLSLHLCEESNCQQCLGEGESKNVTLDNAEGKQKYIVSIPIHHQEHQYGTLIMEPIGDHKIEDWQQQLLETIANHIGIALNISRQTSAARRLVLMEERGAIARDLHDSLAQSLTFMKIQVSRLQALLKKPDSKSEAENVIDELREGLNSAYKELRELLTTFRLKIEGENFNQALEKTVLEFDARSDTRIHCDNQLSYCEFTPNEEVHMLQLIREALSNIVQHAQASIANIALKYTAEGDIQINITDNGIGLSSEKSPVHHYGLSIMKERAKTLGGRLTITSPSSTGTNIKLIFTPTHKILPVK